MNRKGVWQDYIVYLGIALLVLALVLGFYFFVIQGKLSELITSIKQGFG